MSLHLVKKGTLDEYSSGDNTDPIQFEPVSLNQIEVPPVVESNTQVLELLAVEESHIDITLEFLNEEAEIDYKLSLDNLNWHDEIVYGEGGDVAGEISNLDATSGDIRKDIYIKAEVNNDGSVSAGVRTNTKISLLWKSIPIIDGIPTISGLEIEGEILTALPASVSGNPTPTSTWQWKRSGVPISGATNNTYLLVEDDIGETITVVQTETNSAGADSAESAETGEILYYVLIPDSNFEQALIDLGIDSNPVIDGKVLISDVEGVTYLDVGLKNIADLRGIEAFTALEIFYCYENQLTSLDVSNNSALTELDCYFSQLTNLDVSNNTSLRYLDCGENQLTSLNLSGNTALSTLFCDGNQLTNLDVSNNTSLTQLGCSSNQLSSLDLSANTLLDGLYCTANQLTSLDVSANTALLLLNCHFNQLTSLDVSNNTALTELYCYVNQLTNLDVSGNTLLERLFCYENQLNSLNVANGNNTNFTTLRATSNPNLTCIQVDDVAYSEANWTGGSFQFDPQTSFSEDCYVNIPDSNFEQILINLGIDSNPVIDGKVLRSEVEGVTSLNVSSRNISDLTGIEAFTALEELYCQFNQLTSLDLSSHSNLVLIDCADNQLNSLNVANGNNENIIIFLARNNPDLTCVQVDDQAYSEANWNFGAKQFDPQTSFSEDCN
jgi:Leucine-rich repeat (LRR) protein